MKRNSRPSVYVLPARILLASLGAVFGGCANGGEESVATTSSAATATSTATSAPMETTTSTGASVSRYCQAVLAAGQAKPPEGTDDATAMGRYADALQRIVDLHSGHSQGFWEANLRLARSIANGVDGNMDDARTAFDQLGPATEEAKRICGAAIEP